MTIQNRHQNIGFGYFVAYLRPEAELITVCRETRENPEKVRKKFNKTVNNLTKKATGDAFFKKTKNGGHVFYTENLSFSDEKKGLRNLNKSIDVHVIKDRRFYDCITAYYFPTDSAVKAERSAEQNIYSEVVGA